MLTQMWNRKCGEIKVKGCQVTSSLFPFQRLGARLRRTRTPACVTSPRGRRMTLTGCCSGPTAPPTPALTSCGVSDAAAWPTLARVRAGRQKQLFFRLLLILNGIWWDNLSQRCRNVQISLDRCPASIVHQL